MHATWNSSHRYESLFHAASVHLLVPEISSLPPQPWEDVATGWKEVEKIRARTVAFLDEKLVYLVALRIPDHAFADSSETPSLDGDDPPSELLRFLHRLKLNMTASFIPHLPKTEARRPPSLQMTGYNLDAGYTPPAESLAPPNPSQAPRNPESDSQLGPITPNPFPAMTKEEEQYANVEGMVVWEGDVEDAERKKEERTVFKRDAGWEVIWRGDVPIVTLREEVIDVGQAGTSVDTASMRTETETLRTNGTEYEERDDGEDDEVAEMEEIDLLGGLAGVATMPATRLAPSMKHDLSLSHSIASTQPSLTPALKASTSTTSGPSRERGHVPTLSMSSDTPTALRKSFRRVLSLSSGLRVRMRTLFLPQLLPVGEPDQSPFNDDAAESESERRIVLCVEIENPSEDVPIDGFEIQQVDIDVGGKGGKAAAELVCQPEQKTGVFPLKLRPVEQYNLLYAVTVSSTPDTIGRGDELRPVSITVIGRPYLGETFPTSAFPSRWNCSLDLTSFYVSLNTSAMSVIAARVRNSLTNPVTIPEASIAGDKRYCLASLNSDRSDPRRSLQMNGPNGRVASLRNPQQPASDAAAGLLISVKILPQSSQSGNIVRALEPFSIEIFVHNRTEDVRRFRLSIPGREDASAKVREAWEKRRRRRDDEPVWGVDDPVLRQMLLHHLCSAPALVPLENDVRCGPLLPGASLSSRIRFLALRDGVHKLDKLRIAGLGDDFDFVLSPVLDVVVGHGVDAQ